MFVQIKDINFKYKNAEEKTLNHFSLDIEKGEIISIFGESGSGKSTVLRIIAGLEKPGSGQINIGEKVMVDSRIFVQPENRGIGMVFQDYALFPHMTVEQNIKFGLKNMPKKLKAEKLEKVLELVNLEDFKKRYPYELSGGQQQRVALARALAPEPSMLLLDEPFSNLDTDLQNRIREELRKIIKRVGITSIFVTHDRDDSRMIADRVVVLNRGEVTRIGKPSEVLN